MEALIEELKNNEKAFNKAAKKTMKWYQAIIIQHSSLPRSFFKKRSFVGSIKASFWLGLKPVGVHRLGKPRQVKQGVKIKGTLYRSAFLYNKAVFRRNPRCRKKIRLVTEDLDAELKMLFYKYKSQIKQKLLENYQKETSRD